MTAAVVSDVQTLEPGQLIELFDLDATVLGDTIHRFHGYTQVGTVTWNGNAYTAWPIQSQGFARTSAQQPVPTISVGNIDGSITALCLAFDDLVGATVTRRRTLGKYLDSINYPATLITELVSNGTFATSTGWTLAANVTIGSGTLNFASATSNNATYTLAGVVGTTYHVQFDVSAVSAGSVRVGIGGVLGAAVAVNGHVAQDITATTTAVLTVTGVAFTGSVDNISVMAYSNATADPTQEMPADVWYVERKANEDFEYVTFELSSALDFSGVQLPRRQIVANVCSWLAIGGYRGAYCGYAGGAVAQADDTATAVLGLDKCGGRVSSCKLRFGSAGSLPYGSFPAAGLIR